ncbi:MAG: AtpZ/AtpI family protein [Rhizobiaceae bacterium]
MADKDPLSGRKSDGSSSGKPELSEEELERRLKKLDDRLDRQLEEKRLRTATRPDNTGMANALRLSTEFVSAVLVGAALGWGIDKMTGFAPWGMIIFLLLGFCAGVINVLRAAGQMSDPHRMGLKEREAQAKSQTPDANDEDEED